MDSFKLFALNLLTDKMEVDGKNRIHMNISGADIAIEYSWNNGQRKLKFLKNMGELVNFRNSCRNCPIFCLCRRTRNWTLLIWRPWNRGTIKVDNINSCPCVIMRIPWPVWVIVHEQPTISFTGNVHTKRGSWIDIVQKSFKSNLMRHKWLMHSLEQLADRKSYVRMRESVMKLANNAPI